MLRNLRRTFVTGVVAVTAFGAFTAAPAPAAAGALDDAVRLTGHNPGRSVQSADIAAALRRAGHSYGKTVDDADVRWLLDWSKPIRRVVETALGQVGKPYRWGGNGPSSFDCSGLTSYAYRAAGVSIPRTSRAQAGWTKWVHPRNIRTGDLVFFGRPVGHVAVYIGDGEFVEAPRSGQRVRVRRGLLQRGNLVKVGRVV